MAPHGSSVLAFPASQSRPSAQSSRTYTPQAAGSWLPGADPPEACEDDLKSRGRTAADYAFEPLDRRTVGSCQFSGGVCSTYDLLSNPSSSRGVFDMRCFTHPSIFDNYLASSTSRSVNVHHSQSFHGLSTQDPLGVPLTNSRTPYCPSRSMSFLAVPPSSAR